MVFIKTLIVAWTELLRFTMYQGKKYINIIIKKLTCLQQEFYDYENKIYHNQITKK